MYYNYGKMKFVKLILEGEKMEKTTNVSAEIVNSIVFFEVGSRVKIIEIQGGKEVKNQFDSMGIIKGKSVLILKKDRGPVLLKVGDSRVAVGFGQAIKIIVKKEV